MISSHPSYDSHAIDNRSNSFWHLIVIIVSSALLCAVSLNFAIGVNPWAIYIGYFTHPMIFLLNWIPVLLVQMILFIAANRHWLAFFLNGAITMLPAIGNFYKIKFRNDPFSFSDVSSIMAGLTIADRYDLQLNKRIIVSVLFVLILTIVLMFLIRSRANTKFRMISTVVIVLSIWPLWHYVYANTPLYVKLSLENYVGRSYDERHDFMDTGFPYPFLHSIVESTGIPPSGYDERETASLLGRYKDAEIPEARKVNLLIIQLESFCDLDELGIEDINPEVYAPLRELQNESLSGTLIANVLGGGTINTERCVLAGTVKMMDYRQPAWSYVRYLKNQGYNCIGSHPNVSYFFSRGVVMEYLGFDSFLFQDYFEPIIGSDWKCDETYLPEVFRIFKEKIAVSTEPVFSFNVTLQGHGPYHDDSYDTSGEYWTGSGVSEKTDYTLNNYLSLVADTQIVLKQELEKLREDQSPVVVVLYGDHKPGIARDMYSELGISFNNSTEQGLKDNRGTPYIIWANDAAKTAVSNDFVGVAPVISPGYLMNILFNELGWSGPSFMQCTEQIRAHLPIIYTDGYYLEDGIYTDTLSPDGKILLNNYECLQFYLRYRP